MTTLSLSLLIILSAFIFFGLTVWRSPAVRANIFGNFFLFLFVTVFSSAVLFQESLGSIILNDMDGKIDQYTAEDFVAKKYGVTPLYSWYGFAHFQPAILIQSTDQNGIQQKILLNAFTGDPIDAHIKEVSPVTFSEFSVQ